MIAVTDQARVKFQEERQRQGKPRLGIQVRFVYGCGGAGFRVTFTDSPDPFESAIDARGISVYLDAQSRETLRGAVLDWEEGAPGGFILRHPDAALVDIC
jgi:Fe-S cluster assembly iron-binding protein IscA